MGKSKVIITVPEPDDSRFKSWAKLITSVDTTKSNGYAFEGEWLIPGRKAELEVSSVFILYERAGSRKNNHPIVTAYQVNSSGELEELIYSNDESWVLDIRDKVAAALKKDEHGKDTNPLQYMRDETLIEELKRRGFKVTM